MTPQADPSDIESLLQLLNASDHQSDASVIAQSPEQPAETAGPDAQLKRWRDASIEGALDAENRFAIHVVRGMMKSKAKSP
ncbi:MAG TPA: hypothetical protein VGJ20_29415 [Xanthobacteraceae bacterium]